MGRPSKYSKIDLKVLEKMAEIGLTDVQMAAMLEIHVDTFYEYKKKAEFSEALKRGKGVSDEKVERALFERACGYVHKETKFFAHEGEVVETREVDKIYPPDVTACIFWLKNRQPARWRDVKGLEHSGPDGGAIPIETPTIDPKEMTNEELDRFLTEAASRKPTPKKG